MKQRHIHCAVTGIYLLAPRGHRSAIKVPDTLRPLVQLLRSSGYKDIETRYVAVCLVVLLNLRTDLSGMSMGDSTRTARTPSSLNTFPS